MTAARTAVIELLYNGVDPFDAFDPTWLEDETDEWDSHHAWFNACVDELQPRVIVEVGSFLGVSSRHFAGRLRDNAIDGVVICVDTWLGDHVLWNNPRWRPHLRITHGRPEVYGAWMANAIRAGLDSYLCPLSMSSTSGARYLNSRKVEADLVYIDGSHDQGDVFNDLTLYWDLVLRRGGVMLIDDYIATFPGVMHDVDKFCSERRLTGQVGGMKMRLRKD